MRSNTLTRVSNNPGAVHTTRIVGGRGQILQNTKVTGNISRCASPRNRIDPNGSASRDTATSMENG